VPDRLENQEMVMQLSFTSNLLSKSVGLIAYRVEITTMFILKLYLLVLLINANPSASTSYDCVMMYLLLVWLHQCVSELFFIQVPIPNQIL
jgi:hypothetical protein